MVEKTRFKKPTPVRKLTIEAGNNSLQVVQQGAEVPCRHRTEQQWEGEPRAKTCKVEAPQLPLSMTCYERVRLACGWYGLLLLLLLLLPVPAMNDDGEHWQSSSFS